MARSSVKRSNRSISTRTGKPVLFYLGKIKMVDWENMWANSTDKLVESVEENESLQRQLDIAVDFIKNQKTFQSDLVLREIERTRIDDKIKRANMRAGRKGD